MTFTPEERKVRNRDRMRAKAADPAYRKQRAERRRALYFANEEHRATVKKAARSSVLKRRFGLSMDEFLKLHELQGMACAICHRTSPDNTRGWCVDHDHEMVVSEGQKWRAVRGILCGGCNIWLGVLGDGICRVSAKNPVVIDLIMHYLKVTSRDTQERLELMKLGAA